MKNDLRNYIDFILYPALIARQAQGEIFGDPQALTLQAGTYKALCPFHNEKTPSFTMDSEKPLYHCFGCGAGGDWIDFMQKRYNLDFIQALEKLAGIAGAPRFEGNPAQAAEYEKRKTTADVLTTAQAFFIECLKTDQETRAYLDRRGYTQADIDAAGLGAFPGAQATIDYSKGRGFAETDIKTALKWIDSRADYRLVIPYRDTWGRMIGIMGRLTRPLKEDEKEQDKYKPISDMEGIKAQNLFNFDQARGQELLLVEGLLDAAILTARGVPAAALGGSELLGGQLDQAIKHGTKFFILALDNDAAGKAGTEKAIKNIWRAGRRAYVVTLPDGIKDPDELIKAQGIDAFKTALAEKEIAPRWIPGRIINSLPDGGNIYQIVEAIRPYARTAGPVEYSELLDGFAFMYPRETLEKELNRDREKAQNERLKADIGRTLEKAQKFYNDGDPRKAVSYLWDELTELKIQADPAGQTPPLADRLARKFEQDDKRKPGELLGFGLDRFGNLAKDIDGVQPGFYIIAGETHVGKTAFLTNFFLDVITTNQGLNGLYYSLDDNEQVIIGRFLAIFAKGKLSINDTHKPAHGENKAALVHARGNLVELAKAGRLEMKDFSQVRNITDVEADIKKRAQGGRLFVVIDGLQNIDLGKEAPGLRDKNVEIAKKIKQLVDIYRIPVLTSVEVRKKAIPQKAKPSQEYLNVPPTIHDIMETGKFGYNASLIWIIHPKDYQAFLDPGVNKLDMNFDLVKNKLSGIKGKRPLTFFKNTGIFSEGKQTDNLNY